MVPDSGFWVVRFGQALEKMTEEGAAVEKPFEHKQLRFRFPELERSGRMVCQITNLSHTYGPKVGAGVYGRVFVALGLYSGIWGLGGFEGLGAFGAF